MESPHEKKKYAFKTFSQKFSFCFSFVNYEKEKRLVESLDEKLKTNLKNHQTKEKQKEKQKSYSGNRKIYPRQRRQNVAA